MSKKNKTLVIQILFSIVIISVFISPVLIQAQSTLNPNPGTSNPSSNNGVITIKNPFKENSIEGLIKVIVNDILMPIGGVIAVVMIIFAGFLYVTARGNENQIKKAHQALTWAVIGAAILLGAWVISEAIQATINSLKTGN
ncbi:MAG: hypothetical protein JW740_01475 [Candidatus Zambryskibacteria bacterium]|nr:hypothetical protein [Candidatus Zambryskibacteria bacterium]